MISYLDLLNRSFHCYYAHSKTLSYYTVYRLTNVYLIFSILNFLSFYFKIFILLSFLISKEFGSLSFFLKAKLPISVKALNIYTFKVFCSKYALFARKLFPIYVYIWHVRRAYLTLEGNRTKQALRDLPNHTIWLEVRSRVNTDITMLIHNY